MLVISHVYWFILYIVFKPERQLNFDLRYFSKVKISEHFFKKNYEHNKGI